MLFQDFALSNDHLARERSGRKTLASDISLVTCDERPDLIEASIQLEDDVWDDLSFLDYTPAHEAFYNELLQRHPDCRICLVDNDTNEIIGTGMCVPVRVDLDQPLPDEGWDWSVQTCFDQKGEVPNAIAALSISVSPARRQSGYARDMINAMRALAAYNRLNAVIAPVRPSLKSKYPFVPMHDYLNWQNPNGRIFDPWLRSHVAVGGKISRICDQSMVVDRDLDFWRPWSNPSNANDGYVVLPGGLAPLKVDAVRNSGRYVEPNVWVTHEV